MSHIQLKRLSMLISAGLLIMFGFVLGTVALPSMATGSQVTLQVAPTGNQLITDEERIYANVYNQVSPSVVSINISSRNSATNTFDPESLGTGFVIDQQGHIVTNFHVVDQGDRIEVNFIDGTITRAEVVGLDADSDLAVIKVDLPAAQLKPVVFDNSDELIIGQRTLAIGSPFGERWTLTSGIISALGRQIEGLGGYSIGAVIQTDAAINPGNSGGPLLNLEGNVIGVNSQIISRTRSNSGISFAIPSNLVLRVARELIEKGSVAYSFLGITSRSGDVDLNLIEQYGLPNNTRGVVVAGTTPGGPAATAGLQSLTNNSVDIITAINGQSVTSFSTLISYLSINTSPGETVNLTVLRDGQLVNVPLTLGTRR